MNLKNLIHDDDAVSPVIGVILMVAITVILAAVIGTFVLGLGDQLQDTSPTASISFDQAAGNSDEIKVIHDGGASLDRGEISITVEDGSIVTANPVDNWGSGDKIRAGDTTTIQLSDFSDGNVVKVIWTSDGGGSSAVIGKHTIDN